MAVFPKTSFPAFTVAAVGASALTNTASSVAVAIPTTQNGQRPAYVMVSCFQLAATPNLVGVHVRLAPTASSATATTGDTIVTSQQGVWLNTVGMNALAALGITGNVRVQVAPLEEHVIVSSGQPTAGLG